MLGVGHHVTMTVDMYETVASCLLLMRHVMNARWHTVHMVLNAMHHA